MAEEPQPSADEAPASGISRRRLLTTGAATTLVGAGLGAGGVALLGSPGHGPSLWTQPNQSGAQPVGGLHLQFGKDAATEVVVSWHTTDPVHNPRVMMGTPTSGFGRTVQAETRTYRDAKSNTEVRVHHARLDSLVPDTDYVYAAVHDGTNPELGTVRTAPSGRSPLRFTSFGDQAIPTQGQFTNPIYGIHNLGSPAAGDITTAIERLAPLFNLVNGDLCYANLADDRIRTWSDWFDNNTRSARYRPWMPAAGNHENELGNGPVGYAAYQTYFALPDSGSDAEVRGLWYSFTAGSVRVISLNNDDICFQDGGNFYVHGYSGGAQKRWLESELATRGPTSESTGWWSACTRPRSPREIAPTAPTWVSARSGCRCSTATRSIWWCAATSITMNARIRCAERRTAKPECRYPSKPAARSSTPARAPCTSSSAVVAPQRRRTPCSSPSPGAAC